MKTRTTTAGTWLTTRDWAVMSTSCIWGRADRRWRPGRHVDVFAPPAPSSALENFESTPADAPLAPLDKGYQMPRFGSGDFSLDSDQRLFQFQVRAVENPVGALQDADVRRAVPRTLQANQVETLGRDLEA